MVPSRIRQNMIRLMIMASCISARFTLVELRLRNLHIVARVKPPLVTIAKIDTIITLREFRI